MRAKERKCIYYIRLRDFWDVLLGQKRIRLNRYIYAMLRVLSRAEGKKGF